MTLVSSEPQERQEPTATPSGAFSRGPDPIGAGLVSGLLLWLAFPPADCGYLVWVALVPLFLLVKSQRPRWSIYLGAGLGGLLFNLLAVEWVRMTDPSAWLGWLVLGVYLALYWLLFLALTRAITGRTKVPAIVVVPIVWVGLEYARAHALTGFPWFYLAHPLYRALPLIQIADLTGVWGPSFLVALVNMLVVDLLTSPLLQRSARGARLARPIVVRLAVVGGLLVAVLAYGGLRMAAAKFRTGPKIGLLQTSIKQELDPLATSEQRLDLLRDLMVAAREGGAELCVWPETSFPFYHTVVAPGVSDATIEKLALAHDPEDNLANVRRNQKVVSEILHGFADRLGVPVVYGVVVVEFRDNARLKFNCTLLVEPNSPKEQRYDKLHLVPFGEYVPLIESLPWLTRLTPYHGERVPSDTPGGQPHWLEWNGLRLASAICFEDSLPATVRRSFAEVPDGRAPDVLINMSNDGWFMGSPELETHLAVSIFRAIEHRVPLVRAVNTGMSAIIDGNGCIVRSLPKNVTAPLVAEVPLDDREGLYTKWGDWLGITCLSCTVGLVLLPWAIRFSRPRATRLPQGAQ